MPSSGESMILTTMRGQLSKMIQEHGLACGVPSYSGCRSCLTLFAISGLRPQTMIGIGDMLAGIL